ncbi:hypothetical protein NPIL_260761 [Nephila pilipes]|uniref:Uncharacterized protein n=1 Tax=Nephila pilipes TaxID=299642 RepID=A0A8X6UFY1_NEPPI|nr:hypothetical protein NPIL_260761 [Nephila pilipes]
MVEGRPGDYSPPIPSWDLGWGNFRAGPPSRKVLSAGSRTSKDIGGPTLVPGQLLQITIAMAAGYTFEDHPGGSINPVRVSQMADIPSPVTEMPDAPRFGRRSGVKADVTCERFREIIIDDTEFVNSVRRVRHAEK